MAELRRGNDAIRDEAGSAQPGPDLPLPAPPAPPTDRPNVLGRSAPDRNWLSDSYRDDPDDIFGGQDWDDAPDRATGGDAVGSVDATRPETLVNRPALPPDRAVHYGTDYTVRNGRATRPEVFDGPPTRDQAVQGMLGDCGVIAALGAVAGHRPEAIRDLIEPQDDGSHLVRLHDVRRTEPGSWEPTGQRIELAVSPDLPVRDSAPHYAAFANTHDTAVGWAATLEKALAGVDTTWPPDRAGDTGHRGYDRLDQGTYPADQAELLAQLSGRPATAYPIDTSPGSEPAVERWLRERLDSRSPILIGTNGGDRYGRLPNDLTPGHAYEVVSARDGMISLHNPWGRDQPAPLSVREFLDSIVPFIPTLRDDGEEHS